MGDVIPEIPHSICADARNALDEAEPMKHDEEQEQVAATKQRLDPTYYYHRWREEELSLQIRLAKVFNKGVSASSHEALQVCTANSSQNRRSRKHYTR